LSQPAYSSQFPDQLIKRLAVKIIHKHVFIQIFDKPEFEPDQSQDRYHQKSTIVNQDFKTTKGWGRKFRNPGGQLSIIISQLPIDLFLSKLHMKAARSQIL